MNMVTWVVYLIYVTLSSRCSQLQILSLRRTGMAHVSLNCPQLLELDFQSCHKLSDNAIRQAATACPLLAKLDMSSCACVTDETLRDIASSCPNLSVLDASNCPNISFEVCLILFSVSPLCLQQVLHTSISRKIIPDFFWGCLI